jgi:hypothetical protein
VERRRRWWLPGVDVEEGIKKKENGRGAGSTVKREGRGGVRSGRATDVWSCGGKRGGGLGGDQDPVVAGVGCARREQGKDGALTSRLGLQYPGSN